MEAKSKRPDVRVEPTLYARIKELCTDLETPVAVYTRELYVRDLLARNRLTPADMRSMKGV